MVTKAKSAATAQFKTQAAQILDGVESNLGDDTPVPAEFRMDLEDATPAEAAAPALDERSERAREERVWIQLEDSDDIPPGGQFVSVNGYGYKLVPGYPIHVPVSVLGVLDDAIMSIAVIDPLTRQVVGWRNRLRLPYRVLTHYKPPVKQGVAA